MNGFKDVFTYLSYVSEGKDAEFHELFEQAVEKVKKEYIGKEYPIYVGEKELKTDAKLVEKSPIDGSTVCICQKGDREITRKGIAEAKSAFESWFELGWNKRAAIMRKAANIIEKNKFELAAVLSIENGKNRLESIGEVDEAINFLRYYAYLLASNKGYNQTVKLTSKGVKIKYGFQGSVTKTEVIEQRMVPYGVFGIIAPFNFPVSISTGMSVGALITGNTAILKPSSTGNMTMLTGIMIYNYLIEAGVPKGVYNVITGPGSEVGDELVINPDVAGIAFTGSKDVGKSMIKKAYDLGLNKVFVVEMGGKNPAIVTETANIEEAAQGIISAAFGYQGQKCSALSRLYVHKKVKDVLVEEVVKRIKELTIGDPLKKEVYLGPLISEEAYQRYVWAVNLGQKDGKVIYGGKRVDVGLNGYYVEPTLIELKHGHELFKKELFLPILVMDSFENFSDAINMANDTEYGLTAGLYTGKKEEIDEFKRRIQAGVVYVNRSASATTGAIVGYHPFVGWKSSGFTGKGAGSRFYLLQFLKEQSFSVSS
ncbi:MAG: aldehyde dehydrogenase family protein [Nitrososphaeria archaeon]